MFEDRDLFQHVDVLYLDYRYADPVTCICGHKRSSHDDAYQGTCRLCHRGGCDGGFTGETFWYGGGTRFVV